MPPSPSSDDAASAEGDRLDWLSALFVFVAVAVLLAAISWPASQKITQEVGDAAANSLLVQEAKTLHLLVGNYSRLGFNHPGPALLYVLGAGEYLFHDKLHLTPLPVGGQLLAVEIYTAAWIALLFRLLQRLTGSTGAALFASALFVAMSVVVCPPALRSLWFPYLYYFPFAVFVFALARLVRGRLDSPCILALAWGFLINEHASFIPITAIMIVGALAANGLLAGNGAGEFRPLLRRSTWQGRMPSIAVAIAILGFLLLPLAIRVLIETPNPLYQYLTYGSGNPWNGIGASAAFVAYFWGGWTRFLAGTALLAFLWICERSGNKSTLVRAVGTAILCATAAVFVYALAGIDDLSLKYVGLFYYSVPVALVALAGGVVCQRITRLCGGLWPLLIPLLALPLWGFSLYKVAQFGISHGESTMADDFVRIRALGPAPLVLDLDTSSFAGNDWTVLWPRLVGVQNYALHQGVDLYVIRKHWGVLFTPRAKFTGPLNEASPNHFFVTTVDLPGAALRTGGLSFVPAKPFHLESGVSYTVANDPRVFVEHLIEDGWPSFEGGAAQLQGREASLFLEIGQPIPHRIYLDLDASLPPGKTQHVDVSADGRPIGHVDFAKAGRQKYFFDLPPSLSSPVLLKLHIAHPMRPRDYARSDDARSLGVSLYGLGVE